MPVLHLSLQFDSDTVTCSRMPFFRLESRNCIRFFSPVSMAAPPPHRGAMAGGLPVLSVHARVSDFVFEHGTLGDQFLDAPGGVSARVVTGIWRREGYVDVPVALKILVGKDPDSRADAAGDTGTEESDKETRVCQNAWKLMPH